MQQVRVETLRAGDQIAYRGDVFDVVAIQTVDSRRVPKVAVTLDEPSGRPVQMVNLRGETIMHQPYLTALFPPGHMVAAECQVRS